MCFSGKVFFVLGLVLIMGSFFGLLASIMSRRVEGQNKRETAELGLDKSKNHSDLHLYDCRSRGRQFDLGPVQIFRED